MKKSDFKRIRDSFRANQPTQTRGVLDEEKKAHVVLLIASGLSRREAAGFVQCSHTTIGRTAARDAEFASKLSRAEATSNVMAVNAVRGAMRDPKYWRAAAWMLERRSPEEYARRDPNSFTADQVMSLLARLYSETQPLLAAEKVGRFQELFDEALDEVEVKSSRLERPDDSPGGTVSEANDQGDGCAAGNGHASRSFLPERTFADEAASEPASVPENSAENVSLDKSDAQEPDGADHRKAFLAELTADLDAMVAAERFLAHRKAGLDGDGPLAADMLQKIRDRAALSGAVRKRFDPRAIAPPPPSGAGRRAKQRRS